MERRITQKKLQRFMEYLYEEEKSPATVQKYMRNKTNGICPGAESGQKKNYRI